MNFEIMNFEIKRIQYRKNNMRPLKKTKPKNPTILQQQSSKLKEKLDLLKQQVTMKKLEKQMSKTATSLQGATSHSNKLLNSTTKTNMQYPLVDTKFHNVLAQMKIENIEAKLIEKGIKTYEKLLSLTDQQIDQWKDVLVGYRIKIKKFIKSSKGSNQAIKSNSHHMSKEQDCNFMFEKKDHKNTPIYQAQEQKPSEKANKNIEDIIKQRQTNKIFVPIDRKFQQFTENYDQNYEITDQDQDVIIQSFMNVFQPRKGILKTKNKQSRKDLSKTDFGQKMNIQKNKSALEYKNTQRLKAVRQRNGVVQVKSVHWSCQVQRMQNQFEKKHHKKYPKQLIVKQALISLHYQEIKSQETIPQNGPSNDQTKYCWKCFRKIDLRQSIDFRVVSQFHTSKYLCSENCQKLYSEEMVHFSQNLSKQQHQEQPHVSAQQFSDQRLQELDQDIQTIDLSIF